MNHVATALRSDSAGDIENASIEPASDSASELTALLAALSTALRDTIGRFEEISGRVTDSVLTRSSATDDHLVVALQDFDRLQQEFTALGDVISHCATAASVVGSDGLAASGYEAIADITLAELRDRMLNSLQGHAVQFAPSSGIGEQVF